MAKIIRCNSTNYNTVAMEAAVKFQLWNSMPSCDRNSINRKRTGIGILMKNSSIPKYYVELLPSLNMLKEIPLISYSYLKPDSCFHSESIRFLIDSSCPLSSQCKCEFGRYSSSRLLLTLLILLVLSLQGAEDDQAPPQRWSSSSCISYRPKLEVKIPPNPESYIVICLPSL